MTNESATTVPAIYQAMAAVQSDLARTGVGKDGINREQRFQFRKWDDVQQALAAALAARKVIGPHPFIHAHHDSEHTLRSGATARRVLVEGSIRFLSGVDGSSIEWNGFGEAMDVGDKATSKAITMLVKYAVLHGFCIPLEGIEDPDAETHETASAPRAAQPEDIESIRKQCADLDIDLDAFCRYLRIDSLDDLDEAGLERARAAIEKKRSMSNATA